ncbi:MAG: protein kinase [Spirosomataceae bacterium]
MTHSDRQADLAVGILEGLRHLHNTGAQGVVHRDLKPRNVLIQKWGGKYVPKITDFGLSKFSDSVSNSVISQSFKGGTLNYASPEQIKGEQIRRNTDFWAFGVILHEIMTGEVPYKIDDSSESTLRQVYDRMNQQTLPDSFKGVKEPYATIIRKCLVVNPNQRYRTADEVLLDLTQTATPPPPLTSPPLVAEEKKETKAQEAIKDQTEIFEDSPFASFGNLVEETNAKPPVASPDDEAKPILKAHLTSSDPVKSAPPPKEKPKKDFTPIIVGVVVLLGIITATVLYLGHDTPQTTLIPKDTTQSTPSKEITAVVDTLLLGQQADSLFNLPNYPQYAQTILKINEAFPQTKGQHTTQTAIQKLEKGAASWEKYSLTDDDVRSFLTAFSEALLLLDSTNAKGLALKEKLKK